VDQEDLLPQEKIEKKFLSWHQKEEVPEKYQVKALMIRYYTKI